MPRRFLATRQKAQSAVGDRLRAALVYELERPSESYTCTSIHVCAIVLLSFASLHGNNCRN